jgi:hypothetical protein
MQTIPNHCCARLMDYGGTDLVQNEKKKCHLAMVNIYDIEN